MTGEPRRLGLEVWFDARRIDGRLYDQEDVSRLDRRFSGWLGLLTALVETAPMEKQGSLVHEMED